MSDDTPDSPPEEPWTYFEIDIDGPIAVEFGDPDWDEPPINAQVFVGHPVFGRHRAGEFVQWRVRVEPVATFGDGGWEDSFWISTRFVGDEMAHLRDPRFKSRLPAVVQGVDGGAWRAEVWRGD